MHTATVQSQEETFAYTNDDGEEIFGENYVPTSPDIESLPYWVGRPNAGVEIPESLFAFPQEAFQVAPEFLSVPDAGRSLSPEIFAPLRKQFDIQQQRKFIVPNGNQSLERSMRQKTILDDEAKAAKMIAHFVDVGQGDGAILEFPCGVAVVDLGGEFGTSTKGGKIFIEYLTQFFVERPHLNNTIDVIFITHPHADHISGMKEFFDSDSKPKFKVNSIVDNGQSGTSGSLGKQTSFRKKLKQFGASYTAIQLARQITATGVTNIGIDPIQCESIDPVLTAFWGGVDNDTGFSGPYGNPNNHSIVLRVDFGNASFLFTGDLEDKGESDLREEFAENLGVFDVDVYQVSHHGADDDTSDALLEIMTPKIAVISMGHGVENKKHTAWDHGHPRTGLLDVLQSSPGIVSDTRSAPVSHEAYPKQETDTKDIQITKAIYGTGWSGDVIIEATGAGEYRILEGSP
jgi:beta-lactamase superfamily II metal-dependent hydrolase